MKTKHVNYKVLCCGTFINEDYPWLQQPLTSYAHVIVAEYCDFVVCAFGHNNEMALVGQRIAPDIAHWNEVLPKLSFWRVGVLPEVLGRWYTRRRNDHNLTQKDAVCLIAVSSQLPMQQV